MHEHANKKDLYLAMDFFDKSCTLGSVYACTLSAQMYLTDPYGVIHNTKKSILFFTKACELKNSHSCLILAGMYDEQVRDKVVERFGETEKDANKSLSFYEKSCQYEDPNHREVSVCISIGNRLEEGDGFKQDLPKALEFYTIACEKGSAFGCSLSGTLYLKGKKDIPKALKFFQQACDLNTSKCEFYERIRDDDRLRELYY